MYKGSIICVLLVLAFACDYSEAQAYSTTFKRCQGNCVPPGCMCEEPPVPSRYFFKMCHEENSICPIRICTATVTEGCVRLRMPKRQKQMGILQNLMSRVRRSVKPVNREVEFCEEGTTNCYPVCTKDITTLCVGWAYDTIPKAN